MADDPDKKLFERFANLQKGKTAVPGAVPAPVPDDDELLLRFQRLKPNSSILSDNAADIRKTFLLPAPKRTEAEELDALFDEVGEEARLSLLEDATPPSNSHLEQRLSKLKGKDKPKSDKPLPTESMMQERLEKLTGQPRGLEYSPVEIEVIRPKKLTTQEQVDLLLKQALDSNRMDLLAAGNVTEEPAKVKRKHKKKRRHHSSSDSSASSDSGSSASSSESDGASSSEENSFEKYKNFLL